MKRMATLALVVGSAVMVPAMSPAADLSGLAGGYVGLGAGQADWKAGNVNGVTGDSHGTAGKIFGGYNFSPSLGIELGYAKLGKFGDGGVSGDARAHSVYLDGVGHIPLNENFSLLGRLGLADTRTRTSLLGVDSSDSGTDYHLGLGVQYNLTKAVGLRAEWERFRVKVIVLF